MTVPKCGLNLFDRPSRSSAKVGQQECLHLRSPNGVLMTDNRSLRLRRGWLLSQIVRMDFSFSSNNRAMVWGETPINFAAAERDIHCSGKSDIYTP